MSHGKEVLCLFTIGEDISENKIRECTFKIKMKYKNKNKGW